MLGINAVKEHVHQKWFSKFLEFLCLTTRRAYIYTIYFPAPYLRLKHFFCVICISVNEMEVSDGEKGCERAGVIFKCSTENGRKVRSYVNYTLLQINKYYQIYLVH